MSQRNPKAPGSGTSLNVIALISGGKDSLYSILHCIRNGHKVVALANLHPPLPSTTTNNNNDASHTTEKERGEAEDDIDSFMYQTIGWNVIPLYEAALGIPLYRQPIEGDAVDSGRVYGDVDVDATTSQDKDNSAVSGTGPEDETESLIPLLQRIKSTHPEANAVCAGAILSTYQRTRIEDVAGRLGLTPLAWLWQYPFLPASAERRSLGGADSEAGLLEDMAAAGCRARIVKVASGALDEGFLWGDVADPQGGIRGKIVRGVKKFSFGGGEDIRGAVIGEGGEYETLAVDGPGFLWRGRIEVPESGREVRVGDGGVGYLRLTGARVVAKGNSEDGVNPDNVRRPAILDGEFTGALSGLQNGDVDVDRSEDEAVRGEGKSSWTSTESIQAVNGGVWTVSNITAPEAGPGAAEQMAAIVTKIRNVLDTPIQGAASPSALPSASPRTTSDIIFTTVLLRSMADFPSMNGVYLSLFQKPNPPARATVACGESLPDGVNVMVSMVVDLGSKAQRDGLHVQSRSYWAPANIGPYSQAMSVPLRGSERMVYIAGQIPLEPASMELIESESSTDSGRPSWDETYCLRAVLSLQHMWRIGAVMEVGWWLGTVAFFTGTDHVRSRARLAWKLWRKMHTPIEEALAEEEDEDSTLDVWDIKYGRRGHEQSQPQTSTRPQLPNFDLVEAESPVPTFFAVQVHELPKGSDIEWQGLGYRCMAVRLTNSESKFGRTVEATTKEGLRYTAIEIDSGADRDLQSQMQHVLEVYGSQPAASHVVIYTSQPQAIPHDTRQAQIVPCKSVWGPEGRRLAAGVFRPHTTRPVFPPTSDHDVPRAINTILQEDDALSPHPNISMIPTPADSNSELADLRALSRSPHPYHRTTRTSSDSGTEADDESTGLLKGLPVPPLRSRRAWNGVSETDVWLPGLGLQRWPSLARSTSRSSRRSSNGVAGDQEDILELKNKIKFKRRIEIIRRAFETALLFSVGGVVLMQPGVRQRAWGWRKELVAYTLTVVGVYLFYPLNRHGRLRLSRFLSFDIPSSFDPAPLLYPILIPVYVSLSLSSHEPSLILPNVLLALASIPPAAIPMHDLVHGQCVMHWLLTLLPVLVSEQLSWRSIRPTPLSLRGLDSELLTLVFPLHQALIPTLDFLLSTSILPAELQLLTTALINLFLFATSPQAEILKALLWLGSLCIFISCRQVLHWEVALARIPTWKFRRSPSGSSSREPKSILNLLDHRICQRLSRAASSDDPGSDSDSPDGHLTSTSRRTTYEVREKTPPESPTENAIVEDSIRRQSSINFEEALRSAKARTTPRGRRKRLISPDLASFLAMTVPQVQVRKWLYALYTYLAVLAVILGPVRKYVGERALQGEDPFGWALGYLLGNVSWFRFWVITSSLERWIPIPPRLDTSLSDVFCHLGRAEHLRNAFGYANTRLLLIAYCLTVLITGIVIVIRLGTYVEVDTRRKVFHGTMVFMFLPTIYIDPAFCALAMSLVLAIFLLLDLFRASQLPPISRPLTYFLEPYVDGRDYRGPVIVSHIFLLIGSAIPLWLSLSDIARTGDSPWKDWDVASRDPSMLSGIICVGLGDAAASLVGRRFGRRKWFWGGGKSVEGSLAFAASVTAGLMVAQGYLVLGQWPGSGSSFAFHWPLALAFIKAVLAAGGASATEAVLTGCNDNVVVPVVLWLLARGLGFGV
ncbi:uncharacterized protein BDV17DRAFT_298376 [Aspergillus undulatus]|uniref:uncharacterized protein n=1 Tax=Aspergillus undulatus TaxID=1810928 RepID=UPI003CCDA3A1